MHINEEFSASIVISRCQVTAAGGLRWKVRFDSGLRPSITIVARMAEDNAAIHDYYLLPWLDLPQQEIRLCNRTSIAFEAFRFEDLGFFYGMAERVGIRRKWG